MSERVVVFIPEAAEEEVYRRSLLQCVIRQQTASLNMAAALQRTAQTYKNSQKHTHNYEFNTSWTNKRTTLSLA